ncbi:MAG: zeta toxin family protein [Prevotella sp.]|nr:zeta toxin family protein [Prevotella sp.]MBR6456163.1 zeta toxin family protein [Prevotella sp.]
MSHPNLYIIAGPNGAGKTTASYTLLPEMLNCVNFVNADEIARGLSPFSPNAVDVQAARIMLQRIDELLTLQADFAIETTLSTRSYVQLVKRAQTMGYKVHLLFFCLESPEQAIQRVAQRVKEGGHGIPEDIIRRRFKTGLKNLVYLYLPICDNILVFDNTKGEAKLIAKKTVKTAKLEVVNQEMWNHLLQKI